MEIVELHMRRIYSMELQPHGRNSRYSEHCVGGINFIDIREGMGDMTGAFRAKICHVFHTVVSPLKPLSYDSGIVIAPLYNPLEPVALVPHRKRVVIEGA